MKLSELMQGAEILASAVDMDMEITGVCYDSRQAEPGCVFVAITGYAADGNRFIPMAMEKGAVAVVTEGTPEEFPMCRFLRPGRLWLLWAQTGMAIRQRK